MKRICLIILLLIGTIISVNAQDYSSYLRTAYQHLAEGNAESAERNYSVYKKLTNERDIDFEALLQELKFGDWKKSCYIINLGNGYALAVQKPDGKSLDFESAEAICTGNRLGGFTDWHMPTKEEMQIIISNVSLPRFDHMSNQYWTSSYEVETVEDLKKKYGKNYKKYQPKIQRYKVSINGNFTKYEYWSYQYLVVREFKL